MTGEMFDSDVTRESYPLHFAIADALAGTVRPFDQYAGPYIVIGPDVRLGFGAYASAPRGLGIVRLWLQTEDGANCTIYNEATEKQSAPFWYTDSDAAIAAARETLESV